MSADPSGDEEAEGEALAALLGAVEAGDPLTLTLDPPDGVEETYVVEVVSDAEKTPLDRDEPASGNVVVWVRDLDRAAIPGCSDFGAPGRDTSIVRIQLACVQ